MRRSAQINTRSSTTPFGRRRVRAKVERRLAGHGRALLVTACLKLAGQHRQHRIMTQFVMVVEVFLAERKREDALSTNVFISCSINAGLQASTKSTGPSRRPARSPALSAQQKRAGIGGDRSAVKSSHHDALFNSSKIKPLCATFCLHRELRNSMLSCCCKTTFYDSEPRCTSTL
jgi:hypothetical protein